MHELFDWIYSTVVALFIAMIIHIFLFVPTKVSGQSMYPTLNNGEYLIVSKISHVFRETPEYGDIVIIDSRTHRERSWMDDLEEPMKNYIAIFDRSSREHNVWVKRVIGKGGDTLAFKEGHVWRNGEKLKNHTSMNRWNSLWTAPIQCRKVRSSSWETTGTTALTAVLSDQYPWIMSSVRLRSSFDRYSLETAL